MQIQMLGKTAVTTLTVDEVEALVGRARIHAFTPASPATKEIASLVTLRWAVQRGTDDSLRPVVYHVSSRTHKAFGQTADGRFVMQCPETGELVSIRPCFPEPTSRVRFVSLEAART